MPSFPLHRSVHGQAVDAGVEDAATEEPTDAVEKEAAASTDATPVDDEVGVSFRESVLLCKHRIYSGAAKSHD